MEMKLVKFQCKQIYFAFTKKLNGASVTKWEYSFLICETVTF